MLRLSTNDEVLHQAMDEMLKRWSNTASGWRDEARREFQKEYIDELDPAVRGACTAMKSLYALLRKVREECS
ncbi:MAG: hypothetical protein FJ279_20330 [Planctomycetes bacterium]|nr:hypothetical protein [Planctomycetota bacterium]